MNKKIFKGSLKDISAKYSGYRDHRGYGNMSRDGAGLIGNYGVSYSGAGGYGLLYGHLVRTLEDFKPNLVNYFALAGAIVHRDISK